MRPEPVSPADDAALPAGEGTDPPAPPDMLPLLAPELLVATVSAQGERYHANAAWDLVFGEGPVWARLSAEDRRFAAEYVSEAAAGSLVTNQVFLVARDGDRPPAPVLLHFLPVRLPDAPVGRLPVVVTGELLQEPTSWTHDQTKRRRMEMLGQMAMGIAHDFNNLLTSVLGHVELLREELRGADAADLLRPIERAALDGAALVRKIQRYIRHEKAERFETVDLAGIVEEVASLTKPYWFNEPRRLGIAIDLRLEIEDVPLIRGVEAELREVFVNLILNAVQAMPEGGRLTLRVFGDERAVYAEVEDTGIGMPESVRRRIFEPLFTTKGEAGSGMGLTVSYGIVEEHDGQITVRSQPGLGTCFTLRFPPASAPTEPTPPDTTSLPGASPPDRREVPAPGARILVVDDEPMVRSVTARLLRLRGHAVTEAEGGAEALRHVAEAETPFDLVVTDLGMPEMSGRELAYHLRRHHPNLPIILLTGHTDAEDLSDGVDAVVKKPFRIETLEAAIRRVRETH